MLVLLSTLAVSPRESALASSLKALDTPLTTAEIRIRDPFIHVDTDARLYYMYAQMDNRLSGRGEPARPKGVEVYISADLKHWTQPKTVLSLDKDAWGRSMVWAPEMHAYNGRYYIFVTLTSDDILPGQKKPEGRDDWPKFHKRGTQIFHSDSPLGPFVPFANKPHTPEDWMALDGTLTIEDGTPYMVFCHEWVQIVTGTMEMLELTQDLSSTVGEPRKLFSAKDASWCRAGVTDGCYLYRTKTDRLLMIWSNFGENGYAIGIAKSESGRVIGPWNQHDRPLFAENGGHGMIFRSLDGRLLCAFHQPNSGERERLKLIELIDNGDTLAVKN